MSVLNRPSNECHALRYLAFARCIIPVFVTTYDIDLVSIEYLYESVRDIRKPLVLSFEVLHEVGVGSEPW
jgi:hypothetical protein